MNKYKKKKVGILTLPSAHNYGWALQLWALYTFLELQGYDPIVIDRRWNNDNRGLIYCIKRFLYKYLLCYSFTSFIKRNFNKTNEIRDSKKLKDLNLDVYIVGSDQIWRIEHTRGAELNFFLDFLEDDETPIRISYAASFGTDQWKGTNIETKQVAKLLKKFDLISVREDSGVELCKNIFNISNAYCVLDPTLLIKPEKYNDLIKINHNTKKDFLVTYLLDFNKEKEFFVDRFSEYVGLNTIHLYSKKNTPYCIYGSISNWLQKIHDAKYVIVDSFHGMCFAIIFKKNFIVIANEKRGLTRFTSLLSKLNLKDRIIYHPTSFSFDLLLKSIDYDDVYKRLEQHQLYSKNLLLNVLNSK